MNVLQLSGSMTKAVGLAIGDSTKGRLKPARTADPIVKEPPSEAHRSDPLTPVSHMGCTSVNRDYSHSLIGWEGSPIPQGANKGAPQRSTIQHHVEEERERERQEERYPWGYGSEGQVG